MPLPPKLELKVFVTTPGLHPAFYSTRQLQKGCWPWTFLWCACPAGVCPSIPILISLLAPKSCKGSNFNTITVHAQLCHTQLGLLVLVSTISHYMAV